MKHKYLLSLLCGLMFMATAGQILAQTNTTRATAQEITLGEQIISQFTPGSVETLWYKIEATQGKWYEIPHPSVNLAVYENEVTSPYTTDNISYSGFTAKRFKAAETTVYYIRRWYRSDLGDNMAWSVIEINDNRVCEYAETIQIDSVVNVPKDQGVLWYKALQEAGEYYVVQTDILTSVFYSCVGNKITDNDHVYRKTTDTDTYFKLYTSRKGGTFTVKEFPVQSNNTRETALPLSLGEPIECSHIFGRTLYFKVNLEAGKAYEIIGKTTQYDSAPPETSVFDAENNPIPGINTAVSHSPKGESRWFTAPHTGEFYICRTKNEIPLDLLYTITIDEITDNRVCNHVVSVAENQAVSYTHKDYYPCLWWKIDLEEGRTYLVDFDNKYKYSDKIAIYAMCNGENYLQQSNESFFFTSSQTGAYYIHATTSRQLHSSNRNTFTIKKITDSNNQNCASALPIEPDNPVNTTHSFGDELWYKVNVVGGKNYEIDGTQRPSSYSNVLRVFTGCNEDNLVYSGYDKPLLVHLRPKVDGVYYIRWSGNASIPTFTWQINEITDNRVCDNATMITLDTDIVTDHTSAYQNRWYKITLESGKIYEVDASGTTNSLYYYAENICDSYLYYNNSIPSGNKVLIVPPETKEYYFLSKSPKANSSFVWRIKETEGDNRLREFATEVTPGTTFSVDHTESNVRWYKINMDEGAFYSINFTAQRQSVSVSYGDEPYVLKSGYEKAFSFLAKTGGMHYLKFSNNLKIELNCTVESITDNRSCSYPVSATAGDTITQTGINTDGRWFSVALDGGNIYEFDFTNTGNEDIVSKIYATCADEQPLTEGVLEKLLFKPEQTGTYLVHVVANMAHASIEDEWSWSFNTATADNRLCEYATPINVGDTTTIALNNGIRRRWYEVPVEQGKYYEIGAVDAEPCEIAVFTTCLSDKLALISGRKKVIKSESTTTWHISTLKGDGVRWFIKEVAEEGLECEHGIAIALANPIDLVGRGVGFDFTPDGYDYSIVSTGNGAWYKISNLPAGVYEVRLPKWEEYEPDYDWAIYDLHFNVSVFSDCNISTATYVGSAGYNFDTAKFRFNAEANTTYYFLVSDDYDAAYTVEQTPPNSQWEVVCIEQVATGAGRINFDTISLYPTPFDKEIVVEGAKGGWLQIFGVNGWCVHAQKLTQAKETVRPNIPSGVYFFRIDTEGAINSFVAVKR